jgi:uncharacterized protein YndB with AHSA1/START domain
MERTLTFEAVYPHPPERVWRALTERDAIARWLMENDFEPVVGHRFQFRAKPQPGWDGIVHAEVLELVPHERLVLSWRSEVLDTRVTFTLEPAGEGTRLRLVHSGFRGVRATMVSWILGSGWKGIVREAIPRVVAELAGSGDGRTPGSGGTAGRSSER